MVYIR